MAETSNPPDPEAISGALRALGLLYGATQPPAPGSADEAEAIRTYLMRERPHLLKCYDLEALVELVRTVRLARGEAGCTFEQFGPT